MYLIDFVRDEESHRFAAEDAAALQKAVDSFIEEETRFPSQELYIRVDKLRTFKAEVPA